MIGAGLVAVALVAVIGTSSSGGASATFYTPPEAERELLAELRDPAFEFSGDVSVSVTILGGEDPQPVWRGSGTAASTGDSTTIAVAEDPGPSTAHHGWTATAAGQTIHWRSEGQQWSERERTPNALYSFSELFARTEYMLELGPADDQDGLVYFCFGDADLLGGLDPVMLGLPDSLSVGDYYMTYNVIVDAVSPRIIGLTIDAGWFSGADASIWHRMEVLIEFVPGRPAEIEVPDASAPQITPKPTAEP